MDGCEGMEEEVDSAVGIYTLYVFVYHPSLGTPPPLISKSALRLRAKPPAVPLRCNQANLLLRVMQSYEQLCMSL